MKKESYDPRESLAGQLTKAGIDHQTAFFIALDAGSNLVDRAYLFDLHLNKEQLVFAEKLVKDFYWEDGDTFVDLNFQDITNRQIIG